MMTNRTVVDVATISGSVQTMRSVNRQLREYLPEGATLASYSFADGIPEKIYARILLLGGESFEQRLKDMDAIWEGSRIVIAERSVNVDSIQKLVSIGSDRTVLVVNDSAASAQDAVESLQDIGFTSWKYIAYSPEMGQDALKDKQFDCVISVGEPALVPRDIGPVYEIGTRIISMRTIMEVWSSLGWPLDVVENYINKYMERVILMTQRAYDASARMDETTRNLLALFDSLDDGVMVYDRAKQVIVLCNTHLRKMAGIRESMDGERLEDVIDSSEIIRFLLSPPETAESALLEWDDKKLMATRFPLDGDREVCVFRSVEAIQTDSSKLAHQLVRKGFYSKYSFDDILGNSREIQETRRRARKLAQTDLNVLIEGESGTGKELFASAIHQASSRRDKPYLAINFSALNDSLMESELFGYEEGAFTGAKRGGKAGVFELANGGTIFLDEIGDISPKMQVGLLRVLQEKEVMRIGDGKIRYVDVRIIAATNQNLMEKVQQGLFREDLYYRLKIGHLYIPPLRSRTEDIPYLAQKLLEQDTTDAVSISPQLLNWLQNQSWPGNVRELKNTIIYMNAMREGDVLGLSDLPERPERKENGITELQNAVSKPAADVKSADNQLLELIRELLKEDILLGRRFLLEEAKKRGICSSEYQLRKLLASLEQSGYILMGKGKVGIQLK